jgi:hypothetical protein
LGPAAPPGLVAVVQGLGKVPAADFADFRSADLDVCAFNAWRQVQVERRGKAIVPTRDFMKRAANDRPDSKLFHPLARALEGRRSLGLLGAQIQPRDSGLVGARDGQSLPERSDIASMGRNGRRVSEALTDAALSPETTSDTLSGRCTAIRHESGQ